ncbi:hypothetical protein Tco_0844023 [Tanacetum coccineum]
MNGMKTCHEFLKNHGDLPGMIQNEYMVYFQDYEWYEGLEDGELKDKALMKKAEFEESRYLCSFDAEWENFEHANHIGTNANYNPYLDISQIFNCHAGKSNEEAIKDNRRAIKEGMCELLRNPCEILAMCKIERFEVIKYSFGPVEDFVAIKECSYDDWMRTEEDACHAYQDIFTKMDEWWFVTRAE